MEVAVKVKSTIYPGLLVTDPKVQFVDGEADVDAETAEKLRALDHMGVVVPKKSTRPSA